MRLIIVSGLSGSGKSVALATLEDSGFYCIDNLPVDLLDAFGRHIADTGGEESYAVGIDARNRPASLAQFPSILDSLREQGLDAEIVFLDADDPTLLKRFSETRRRHPLSGPDLPLAEAIQGERERLMPLHERADLTVDTTRTTLHELRGIIRARLTQSRTHLSVQLESFGYKHGTPTDADFVFDSRCLPNPHWQPALRPLTGRDQPVIDFLDATPLVARYRRQISDFMEDWLPVFEAENRSYLTVAIGCTGGQHRSVYLVEALAANLRQHDVAVTVRHRELP
ncbi:RNase adapter RapZ [Spiribacter insolitus]|uniref:RNase adapter RapZ n=1 Tax=Spiribacter insolitus TaxID=3122417 RepID=A0ABV3T6R2_9GAMM